MSDWIDELKGQIDLVSVVEKQVKLQRAGKEFKGLCPFHEEKTPSFYVVPAKGFYKCFGCGESGDAFNFVMKTEAVDFLEAARRLAGQFGVTVEERKPRRKTKRELARMAVQDEVGQSQPVGVWSELGLADVAEQFGLGRQLDGEGEKILLPLYRGGEVPLGWLQYRVERTGEDGRPVSVQPLGPDERGEKAVEDLLFEPRDLRTQLVRDSLVLVDDPLTAVLLRAKGYGAVSAPCRSLETLATDAPMLTDKQVDRIQAWGVDALPVLLPTAGEPARARKRIRALHATEEVLASRGIELLLILDPEHVHETSWQQVSSWESGDHLRALLADPQRTLDVFQFRVNLVSRARFQGALTLESAVEKLRPTLVAAEASGDRALYHAYMAWAGRALGLDRQTLTRLVYEHESSEVAGAF